MVRDVFRLPLELPARNPRDRRGTGPSAWIGEYVGGKENRLVRVAAEAIVQHRHERSPIVFYGPAGSGKSSLLLGLAEQWRRAHPRQRRVFSTGADFVRDHRLALDTNSLADFRAKYRRSHLAVIDDLQEVTSKASAQIEFLHTIDALADESRLLVVSLHASPLEIPELHPGLASRLMSGLTVPLVPPAAAARRVILQRLAAQREIVVDTQLLDVLLEHFAVAAASSCMVPEIDHVLEQLAEFARTSANPLDADTARSFFTDHCVQQEPQVRDIAKAVCRHFQLRLGELRGTSRQQRMVRARGVAMLLARRLTNLSLEQIGQAFGKRDHTTVLHACRRTELLLRDDPAIRQAVDELTAKFAENC